MGTTVDYILTGAETPSAQDALTYSEELHSTESEESAPIEMVTLSSIKALLDAEHQKTKRRNRKKYVLLGLVFALLLGVLGYYIAQVAYLKENLSGLQTSVGMLSSQVQGSLSGIQANIEESLNQQASLLSDYGYALGDYDADTKTATLHLSATPKTLTEDTTALCFPPSPAQRSRWTKPFPQREGFLRNRGRTSAYLPQMCRCRWCRSSSCRF